MVIMSLSETPLQCCYAVFNIRFAGQQLWTEFTDVLGTKLGEFN